METYIQHPSLHPLIRIADEVFIAAAQLHFEWPSRTAFANSEVAERVRDLFGDTRKGVTTHISQHCVANKPPSPADLRMLFAPVHGQRRLLVHNDPVHPSRKGDYFPDPASVPPHFVELITWAKQRFGNELSTRTEIRGETRLSSILRMAGMGRVLWGGENADEYVRSLRSDWK